MQCGRRFAGIESKRIDLRICMQKYWRHHIDIFTFLVLMWLLLRVPCFVHFMQTITYAQVYNIRHVLHAIGGPYAECRVTWVCVCMSDAHVNRSQCCHDRKYACKYLESAFNLIFSFGISFVRVLVHVHAERSDSRWRRRDRVAMANALRTSSHRCQPNVGPRVTLSVLKPECKVQDERRHRRPTANEIHFERVNIVWAVTL